MLSQQELLTLYQTLLSTSRKLTEVEIQLRDNIASILLNLVLRLSY